LTCGRSINPRSNHALIPFATPCTSAVALSSVLMVKALGDQLCKNNVFMGFENGQKYSTSRSVDVVGWDGNESECHVTPDGTQALGGVGPPRPGSARLDRMHRDAPKAHNSLRPRRTHLPSRS
jgi:hypothetical protein